MIPACRGVLGTAYRKGRGGCWDGRGHTLGLRAAAEAALSHNGFTRPCCPLPPRGAVGTPPHPHGGGSEKRVSAPQRGPSAGTQMGCHLLQPPPHVVGAPRLGGSTTPCQTGVCPVLSRRIPTGGSGTPLPPVPPSSAAACEQLQRRVQLKIEAGGRTAPGGDLFITRSLISAWESQGWGWGVGGVGGGSNLGRWGRPHSPTPAAIMSWGRPAGAICPTLESICWCQREPPAPHTAWGGAEPGLGPRGSMTGADIGSGLWGWDL